MSDCKIRDGFRVIGRNTSNGELSQWTFPTLDDANAFAKQLCVDTGEEVDVTKYLGSWKISAPPTEFVPATDV